MKAVVGVVLTAALGAAMPHFKRSASTCGKQKLPWLEHPGGSNRPCDEIYARMITPPPSGDEVEKTCGTAIFCDAFNPKDIQEKELEYIAELYGYRNNQECFSARNPEPGDSSNSTDSSKLPWVKHPEGSNRPCHQICLRMIMPPPSGNEVEKTCGTLNFCDAFNPKYIKEKELKYIAERYGYSDDQQCYNAHDAAPQK